MTDIFISYSSNDSKKVRQLVKALQSKGANLWFDDERVLPGDDLIEKMKEGMKKGEKPDEKGGEQKGEKPGENGEGESEQMNGELYEIYKEQSKLREALKEMLGNQKGGEKEGSGDAIKQMEELEKEMLEKGFSKGVIENMKQLNYELLKLEKATLEQGEDKNRESDTNIETFEKRNIE